MRNWIKNYPVCLDYEKGIDNLFGWTAGNTPKYLYMNIQNAIPNTERTGVLPPDINGLWRLTQVSQYFWFYENSYYEFSYILSSDQAIVLILEKGAVNFFGGDSPPDNKFFCANELPFKDVFPYRQGDSYFIFDIDPYWINQNLLMDSRESTGAKCFSATNSDYYQVLANKLDKSYCLISYNREE